MCELVCCALMYDLGHRGGAWWSFYLLKELVVVVRRMERACVCPRCGHHYTEHNEALAPAVSDVRSWKRRVQGTDGDGPAQKRSRRPDRAPVVVDHHVPDQWLGEEARKLLEILVGESCSADVTTWDEKVGGGGGGGGGGGVMLVTGGVRITEYADAAPEKLPTRPVDPDTDPEEEAVRTKQLAETAVSAE